MDAIHTQGGKQEPEHWQRGFRSFDELRKVDCGYNMGEKTVVPCFSTGGGDWVAAWSKWFREDWG